MLHPNNTLKVPNLQFYVWSRKVSPTDKKLEYKTIVYDWKNNILAYNSYGEVTTYLSQTVTGGNVLINKNIWVEGYTNRYVNWYYELV